MTRNTDGDWTGYYAWSSGRQPRSLLLAACEQLGDGAGRMAVDLGCGDGTDVLALLERGWSVQAVEIQQARLAILRARIPTACAERIRLVCASFADMRTLFMPVSACRSALHPSFRECGRRYAALVPGGIFAGQLFGTHDSWAGNPGMTFQDRSTVISLLDGLDILQLHETERDGEAYSGPKHWHTYDILVRKPAKRARPGGV